MVVTNNKTLASTVQQLKGQGVDPDRRYWFPVIGYNYRMTNMAAAVGLAQIEDVEWHMNRRLEIAQWYERGLRDLPGLRLQSEFEGGQHAYWMFTVMLEDTFASLRDEVMDRMLDAGVETRPGFYPVHSLPPYASSSGGNDFPVANQIALQTISLPTSAALTESDAKFVIDTLIYSMNAINNFA
jgi:perosamine synthetase